MPETGLLERHRARTDKLRLHGKAQAASISLDLRARRPAEQPVDGRVVVAAAQIPERVVDGADADHVVAAPRVAVEPVHLVPQRLDGKRVLADKKRTKLAIHNSGAFRINRTVHALQSGVGPDLEIHGVDGNRPVRPRSRLMIRLGPVFIVNVKRIDLRLPVDIGIALARS
jgi:hypothetical protein